MKSLASYPLLLILAVATVAHAQSVSNQQKLSEMPITWGPNFPDFGSPSLTARQPTEGDCGNGCINVSTVMQNGVQVPSCQRSPGEISSGIVPSDFQYPPGDVRRYGATGNGTTDDSGAIQTALNVAAASPSKQPVLLAAGANYRLASGITIPPTVYVYGLGASPDSNVGWATRLTCDLSVATCVTIGHSGGSPGAGLFNVSVWRASGTIPSGSIGILVLDGQMIALSHVNIMRHAIGVEALEDGAGSGIGLNIDTLNVGIVSDAFLVMNTWAEARIVNSRFGSNGNDITSNTYVRFMGGNASAAGAGPNTLYVTNSQFNASPTPPTHWLEFVKQTVGTVSPPEEFHFVNDHIEDIATGGAFIYSDSTWPSINGLFIDDCWFSPDFSGTRFLALNAATTASRWHVSHNTIATGISFAPASAFSNVEFSGNDISGNVSITGAGTASTYTSVGNMIGGTLTYAGTFRRLRSDDELLGALTFSAAGINSGSIDLTGSSFAKGTWTPTVLFGGGSTGQTYSRQTGLYQIVGNQICGSWEVIFTALGSSTGTVTLSGLPFPVANQISANGGGGPITYYTGMSGLTSIPVASARQAASTFSLWNFNSGNIASLQNTNFTSSSTIAGNFCYEWQ